MDIKPTDQPASFHPREDIEFFRDPITDRLLPPAPLQPYGADTTLTDEAVQYIETTTAEALNVLHGSPAEIPDDIVEAAVVQNCAERFSRAHEALEEYYAKIDMSQSGRRIFELHEFNHPEDAMIFFDHIKGFPSLDIGAALCSHDTYTIAGEIIARTENRYPTFRVVDDDLPHLKVTTVTSPEDQRDYALITSKKIIAEDENPFRQYKMKRRKTYVAPLEELAKQGLLDDETSTPDLDQLAERLQKAQVTPGYLHPVMESVFIERVGALRTQDIAMAMAMGRTAAVDGF